MDANDPRHGTTRGYRGHRREGEAACDACRRAAAGYEATRVYQATPRQLDSRGVRRRLQALVALGWNYRALAAQLADTDHKMVHRWANTENLFVYRATVEKVGALYERLCMTRPEGTTAHRARLRAARLGWAPPLAWDDIDRDEHPADMGKVRDSYARADLIAEYEHLVSLGVSRERALEQLGVTKEALRRAYSRGEAA